MFGKILAVLEVEFLLPTLLSGDTGDIATSRGIAQNGGTKLLIDEDAGRVPSGHPSRDGRLEAVVDHPLGGGDLRGLLGLKAPFQPNIPVWKEPRWSNGKIYKGWLSPSVMRSPPETRGSGG